MLVSVVTLRAELFFYQVLTSSCNGFLRPHIGYFKDDHITKIDKMHFFFFLSVGILQSV